MQTNNNTKGIFFIMTGMAFFSIQDSLIKFIFEKYKGDIYACSSFTRKKT